MKNNESKLSTLAWTRSDFEKEGEEVPTSLIDDDIHTEGELMDREEVDAWITDSYKTFCIFHEQDTKTFDRLYDEFVIDVHYLQELGKLTAEEADVILNKDNYSF